LARKTDIRLRRSNVANAIPGAANLSDGELAMNTMDGALYFKKSDGTIITAHDNTIMHIDSANDRVGINTTNPTYKLHVGGSGASYLAGGIQLNSTDKITIGNPNQFITAVNDTSLTLATDGSASLTILDNGNVGIGTTSPATALEVAGDITLPSNGQLKFKGTNHYPRIYAASNDLLINLDNGSGSNYTALKIDNVTGNVGIGAATPDKKLTVDGDVKIGNGDAFMSANVAGSTRSLISLGTDNILRIKGNDAEGSSNVISMIAGGNVGIGTTAPEEDLHVVGDVKLTGTLFNGTRDEYTNSNLIRLNQRYTGGAVSGTSYFEQNEYQKVVTITPNGSSENYQVSGTYYVQSAGSIQEVHFVAGLRSGVLPDLTWSIYYDQSNNGTAYIEPFLWTKETTTAGFILGFKVLTGSIFGSVTADIDIIPRNADDKDNVSINTTVQSEQTTIDTGFTNQSFTLRKSVINANTGLGANPGSYRLDVAGNSRISGSVSLVGTLQSYSGAFNIKNIAQDQNLNLQVNDGGTNTTALTVQGTTANVGIGTTSPSDKLHLNGAANAATGVIIGNNNSTRLRLYHDDNAGASLLSTDAVGTEQQLRIRSGSFLALDTGGTSERVRITADGDVGIGTTSPSSVLNVHSSTDPKITISNGGGTSPSPELLFFRQNGVSAKINYNVANKNLILQNDYATADTSGNMYFNTRGANTRMTITGDGNVGIGDTNPSFPLDVNNTSTRVRFKATTGHSNLELSSIAGRDYLLQSLSNGEFTIHDEDSNANRLNISTAGAITFNNAFTFPTSIGNSGQILKVPSTGTTLVWADDAGGGSATVLTDTDGDTKIQVEESADEDVIRFDVAGSEIATMTDDGVILNDGYNFEGGVLGAIKFKAQAGEALTKGNVVYISGISGNTVIVSKADANDSAKMPAFGLAGSTVSLNAAVEIVTFGTLLGVDTSTPSFALGEQLYVSTTAGELTNSVPTGSSSLIQKMGKVTRVDASAGSIKVMGAGRTNATPNLDEGRLFVGNSSNQSVQGDDTLYVDMANSRVGINTTSPLYALQTVGSIYANAGSLFLDSGQRLKWGNSQQFIEATNSGPMEFGTGNAIRMTIDSSGNVSMSQNLTVTGNLIVNGTATTINTATLDVEDKNITLNYSSGDSSGSADGAGITIQDAVDASTDATFNWNATNDRWELSHSLNFQDGDPILWGGNSIVQHTGTYTYIGDNAASNSLRLTGGNLGIGKNPSYKLDVSGSINAAYSATNANIIGMHNGASGEGWIRPFSNGGDFEFNVKYPGGDSDYIFYVNDSTELLRIKESGNVGIGTNDPQRKLEVVDNILIDGSSGANLYFRPNTSYSTAGNFGIFTTGLSSGTYESTMTIKGYGSGVNDVMTIKGLGNVGIGDTSPSYKLDVNGTGRFTGAVTMDSTLTFSNNTATNMLNMGNNNIIGVNAIQMADPGPNEGISFSNIKIYESPDDLTTNSAGNFQVVYGSTRRLTVNNTGIDVNGTITGATNISKLAASTATGNINTEDGANTWAKLATYSRSGNYNDGSFVYAVVTEEQTTNNSGLISVKVRWHDATGSSSPTIDVQWISLQSDGVSNGIVRTDSFKLIGDSVGGDIELWVQKKTNYGHVELWELAYNKETSNAVTVSYETNSAWQSSTPTGTLVNKTSSTLKFDGRPVIIGDNFANDTDVKIAGDLLLEVAASPSLTLKDTTNNVTFKSYAQDSNAFTGTTSSHNLLIGTNNTEAIRINNSQQVGINQGSPTKRLHVKNSSNDDNNILLVEASGATTYGVYIKSAYSGQMGRVGALSQSDGDLDGASIAFEDFGRDIAFRTNEGSNNSEKARILANGNVGIGDSSPSAKLHVVGSVLNNSIQDYGIAAFENSNLEGLSIGYDADGGYTYLYSREVGVSSRGLHLNGSIYVNNYGGNVGIGTTSPDTKLDITTTGVEGLIINQDTSSASVSSRLFFKDSTRTNLIMNVSGRLEFRTDGIIGSTSGTYRVGVTPTLFDVTTPIKIEEYQIDTTETSTTATTQVAIHTFAGATFRSARYTVQVTNSTDSAYHTTELLLVHDGTTANITEFGTIFTGTAAEATFDADINSGNVRLLATPASTDSMEFKVIAHSVTV